MAQLLAAAGRAAGRAPAMPRRHGYRLVRAQRIGYADRDFPRDCLIRLIDFPDLLLRTGMRETIKAGRSALVVRAEVPIAGRMQAVAYKRVRRRTWLKTLTSFAQPNRALRAWRLGDELLARGIATPRPLAVIVPRWFAFRRESWLATEWLEGACKLTAFLDGEARRTEFHSVRDAGPRDAGDASGVGRTGSPSYGEGQGGRTGSPSYGGSCRSRILAAAGCVGRLLGRMHAAGIAHRDLKASNLLLGTAGGELRAWVIDLDGAAVQPRVSSGRRLRNLARLVVGLAGRREVTHTARLRFLRSYLNAAGDSPAAWKSTWRGLAELSRKLAARKCR
ncbi:MAG TPA: lipopolysaccharide kinase InaA family protein [Planctomycetaceae bacterium]|nr:lipopolysaccharide kinase InaA family protein [Planctomycetaceae bacterium]